MNVDLLGPLVVRCGNVAVVPTAPKPRTVLAMLALHANQVLSVNVLINELWDGNAPSSATTTVQTYVLQLRTLIADALRTAPAEGGVHPKQILATHPSGYQLNVSRDRIDLLNFRELTKAGHRARERGDFRVAAQNFADALALWRGHALADVDAGPHLKAMAAGLEETRLNVLDRRIEAELRLGRHYEVLGELVSLVFEHRTHEGLWAHLMHALYRSGRRSEALDAYRQLRSNLIDECGLEPSPSLRRLQRSMLVSGSESDGLIDQPVVSQSRQGAANNMIRNTHTSIPLELALSSWDVDGDSREPATQPTDDRTGS
jgi:SARP family transcriptional regulator, regulator of embCAB operon